MPVHDGYAQFVRGALLGLRLAIAGLMIYAGASKLLHPFEFLHAVYSYRILGPDSGLWVAVVLPWFEVLIGLALLTGRVQSGAFLAALLLFAIFVVAQVSALRAGLAIGCGCFGPPSESSEQVSVQTVLRTALMGLLALAGVALSLLVQSCRPGGLPASSELAGNMRKDP